MSLASRHLGWQAAWLSEIEAFPSAVLAHHWPDVPNVGDMRTIPERIRRGDMEAPEFFTGGTPCQAFSVAGNRESLSDDRGALSLTFCEIADAIDDVRRNAGLDPCIVQWENVPGCLSTSDNAFGCFLAGLVGERDPIEPGPRPQHARSTAFWRWEKSAGVHVPRWPDAGCVAGPRRTVAWRVLDAQYFGLAQRRERVFVVGSARKGFSPGAVLFESEGVRRDSPPSREAWKAFAAGTLRSTDGGSDVDHARAQHLIADVICMAHVQGGAEISDDRSPTLTCNHEAPIAAYQQAVSVALRGREGGATAELGDDCAFALRTSTGGGDKPHVLASSCKDHGGDAGDVAPTLRAMGHGGSHENAGGQVAVAVPLQEVGRRTGVSTFDPGIGIGIGSDGDPMYTLQAKAQHGVAVAYMADDYKNGTYEEAEIARPLTTSPDRSRAAPIALAFHENQRAEVTLNETAGTVKCAGGKPGQGYPAVMTGIAVAYTTKLHNTKSNNAGKIFEERSPCLDANSPAPALLMPMAVRRLTPRECEALQGMPSDHTKIPWRGRPASECPDGPRYKAIGNSWAVKCVSWILDRVQREVERLEAQGASP